jgi:hypothetical protein
MFIIQNPDVFCSIKSQILMTDAQYTTFSEPMFGEELEARVQSSAV